MSLPQCGICGEAIGLIGRCEHQPAPVVQPALIAEAPDDWIEEFLFDDVDDSVDLYAEDLTTEDLNLGLPFLVLQDINGLHADPKPANQ